MYAIMTPASSLQSDSYGAKIQIQIIMHYNQIFNPNSSLGEKISDEDTRLIHPGMRESNKQWVGSKMPRPLVSQSGMMEGNPPSDGRLMDNHSSNIMSGGGIVLTRVAKANDERQQLFLFLLGLTLCSRSGSRFFRFGLFGRDSGALRLPFLGRPSQ